MPLRLGTRGSQLALCQARAVASQLESAGHRVEQIVVRTSGDRLQDAPLSESGGKRLFVKDLEDALLRGEIDLAVHSAKDLPSDLPDGLTIAAALPREDPRDAVVLPAARGGPLPMAAIAAAFGAGDLRTVGTGSVRRVAQLALALPGSVCKPVRGNVDTRLRKLDGGDFDALILACAGLRRLGLDSRISAALAVDRCVPAPGQGVIVIEARRGDEAVARAVRPVHDEAAGLALAAERALVEAFGGDCQIPLGALARLNGASMEMDAIVCSLDGRHVIRRQLRGAVAYPERLGRRLADELAAAGATGILDEVRRAASRPDGAY